MSMQRIGISDQKIIAQSVFAQPKNFANNKGLPSEKQKNKSLVNEKSFWLGVGAIASVVVAGILITRGKKRDSDKQFRNYKRCPFPKGGRKNCRNCSNF